MAAAFWGLPLKFSGNGGVFIAPAGQNGFLLDLEKAHGRTPAAEESVRRTWERRVKLGWRLVFRSFILREASLSNSRPGHL